MGNNYGRKVHEDTVMFVLLTEVSSLPGAVQSAIAD